MDKFIINGGKPLFGEIEVGGAKNAILPIMAATLLINGTSVLEGVPDLVDIKTMAHVMRIIGAKINHENERMEVDASHCSFFEAPYELVSKMRASIYVLGPLLARFGEAKVSFPGGCAIGTRPIDLHIFAMEKLGAEIQLEGGYVIAKAKKLKGAHINFEKSSVGATCNALMASVLAEGKTVISNAAKEPEIDNLIKFLALMGAHIEGIGTSELTIIGTKKLRPVTMKMMPDRIEAGTFMLAGAITGGEIFVKNAVAEHLESLIEKMKLSGCEIDIQEEGILVKATKSIKSVDIITEPYPGFPTDLQAQFLTYMTLAKGTSCIIDTIFPDRFMHVAELLRLNADIKLDLNKATINGVSELNGAEIMATDLRASAALVLAGLVAKGQTKISRIYHIDRGYYRIEEKLKKIGADIVRIPG